MAPVIVILPPTHFAAHEHAYSELADFRPYLGFLMKPAASSVDAILQP